MDVAVSARSLAGPSPRLSFLSLAGRIALSIIIAGAALAITGTAQAFEPEIATRYFIQDHLGSTVAVYDERGARVAGTEYLPFGATNSALTAGAQEHRPGYTGKEHDGDCLQYFGARYHDPCTGRFLSGDPAAQFASPYLYAFGDPLSYTDPDGRYAIGVVRAVTRSVSPVALRDSDLGGRMYFSGSTSARQKERLLDAFGGMSARAADEADAEKAATANAAKWGKVSIADKTIRYGGSFAAGFVSGWVVTELCQRRKHCDGGTSEVIRNAFIVGIIGAIASRAEDRIFDAMRAASFLDPIARNLVSSAIPTVIGAFVSGSVIYGLSADTVANVGYHLWITAAGWLGSRFLSVGHSRYKDATGIHARDLYGRSFSARQAAHKIAARSLKELPERALKVSLPLVLCAHTSLCVEHGAIPIP